jgi:uncharacterized protein YicC (UPF0701 family)
MSKLKLFSIFMASVTVYSCSTNFNYPKNNDVTDTELNKSVVKFVNSRGKIAYEIKEDGNVTLSKNSNLSNEEIKNLNKILNEIDNLSSSKKNISSNQKQSISQSVNNLFKKAGSYLNIRK